MTVRLEVPTPDRRVLDVYDAGAGAAGAALTVVGHHGSPHTGAPLDPWLGPGQERRRRLVTDARPSCGRSTPRPGRDVASAAADVAAIADALDLDRVAVMGASGGGPHALACAALLAGRVPSAVTFASPAPSDGVEDWRLAGPAGHRPT